MFSGSAGTLLTNSGEILIPIKIKFVDFWPGFNGTSNYFTDILHEVIEFVIDEDPDFLFYSNFGKSHRKYKRPIKIYFTGENRRPNPFECDYAVGFDYSDRSWIFRWPLYNLYPQDPADPQEKNLFCCALVSNEGNPLRLEFLRLLNEQKKVDSGGLIMNNIGRRVQNKAEFISRYKFCLAIENSSFPGYCTEKLFEAKMAGCIPIYWGDPLVARDFNPYCFIDLSRYPSMRACITDIIAIDNDPGRYKKMVAEPLRNTESPSLSSDKVAFVQFLATVFSERKRRARLPVVALFWEIFQRTRSRMVNWRAMRQLLPANRNDA